MYIYKHEIDIDECHARYQHQLKGLSILTHSISETEMTTSKLRGRPPRSLQAPLPFVAPVQTPVALRFRHGTGGRGSFKGHLEQRRAAQEAAYCGASHLDLWLWLVPMVPQKNDGHWHALAIGDEVFKADSCWGVHEIS